jgi:uncharacterized cupin superfamily protein
MNKVNVADIPELETRRSPTGKFVEYGRMVSEALGRERTSFDLRTRHPFDVQIARVPARTALCPYHSHTAQWEFYIIISGDGTVRDEGGKTEVRAGDAFVFPPGEAHQIINTGDADLVFYIIADNPVGDTCHYPDSGKWWVWFKDKEVVLKGEQADYFDGEDEVAG